MRILFTGFNIYIFTLSRNYEKRSRNVCRCHSVCLLFSHYRARWVRFKFVNLYSEKIPCRLNCFADREPHPAHCQTDTAFRLDNLNHLRCLRSADMLKLIPFSVQRNASISVSNPEGNNSRSTVIAPSLTTDQDLIILRKGA